MSRVRAQTGEAVSEIGELVGLGGDLRADDKALEVVFESLGRGCVRRLVAVPHPLGLPPRDRLVAQRWLWRRAWAQQWKRDVAIVLALVALGLAAALLILGLHPAAEPVSDAVRMAARG